jgi:hypothetical protein
MKFQTDIILTSAQHGGVIVGGAAGSGGAGKKVKEGIRTYDMYRAREGEQHKPEGQKRRTERRAGVRTRAASQNTTRAGS